MSVFAVRNLNAFLETMKQKNWNILTLTSPDAPEFPEISGPSGHSNNISLDQVSLDRNTLLIVGSEGSGIPEDVANLADRGVYIPACPTDYQYSNNGETDTNQCSNVIHAAYIDSINVSVAVGIALFH